METKLRSAEESEWCGINDEGRLLNMVRFRWEGRKARYAKSFTPANEEIFEKSEYNYILIWN